MNICSGRTRGLSHDEICYELGSCPYCDKVDELQDEIEKLKSNLEDARRELEDG